MNIIVNKITTAVACINTGRNFIGFEISKDYCLTAEQRLKGNENIYIQKLNKLQGEFERQPLL